MADDTFYMRVRGTVSGPFDIPTLQKLVRRGALSRIHEISSDRAAWSAAGEFEDLFPSRRMPADPVEPAAAFEEVVSEPPPALEVTPAAVPASGGVLYFYTQRGSTVGPVALSILKVLVENGTLRPNDLVWRENADTGAPASQMPMLAPLFAASTRGSKFPYANKGYQRLDQNESIALQSAIASAGAQARMVGIGAGVGILILMNLPWFTIKTKPVWWWDLYQTPAGGSWATLATFIVVAAAVLCITTSLLNGVARGIVFLSLMIAAWIFLSVTMLISEMPESIVLSLVFPLALAVILGVCEFRKTAPDSTAGRVILGIGSGIITLGMFMGLVESFRQTGPFNGVPSGIIFATILIFIGLLVGLAAGIMGFTGLKTTFTPALNITTSIACGIALLLPSIGILVAMTSASTFFDSGFTGMDFSSVQNHEMSHLMVAITGRLLLIVLASLSVVAVGIRELLVATHANSYQQ